MTVVPLLLFYDRMMDRYATIYDLHGNLAIPGTLEIIYQDALL